MRRTKLVATIGPACDSEEMLRKLFEAGVNVARVNFSHGDEAYHRGVIRRIKEIRDDMSLPIAILQDLQGPKVRIGVMDSPTAWLERGARFVLTSEKIVGSSARASVSLPSLARDVREGHRILLADGMIELQVESVQPPDVHCRVVIGGFLSSHKGVNIPGAQIDVASLSSKDRHDIQVGLDAGVDSIALSFVRSARDIEAVREVVHDSDLDVRIMAKIEKPQAVTNIDEILEAADGVMIARGDLGIEIDLAKVPLIQKMIIRKANLIGKPVITATQMLIRMVDNTRPTRAEAADVANAILDGTDAIMLSEETAAGQYPFESVQTMDRIALEVENSLDAGKFQWGFGERPGTSDAITRSSFNIARGVKATGIITPTWSGYTARLVSRFRPKQPIIATTANRFTASFLAFCWGVHPILVSSADTIEEQLRLSVDAARDSGLVQPSDLVVITGGTPLHSPGTTNFIKVEQVG